METERFKERYRIQSTRWRSWDYGNDAAYFVTICTQDRRCDFGSIMNGSMQLSPLGHVAWECWQAIPDHFPFVHLGEFVVMPNHVHGIVVIDRAGTGMSAGDRLGIAAASVETQNFASLRSDGSADPAGSDGSGGSAILAKPGSAPGNTTATPILGSTGIAAASVETQKFCVSTFGRFGRSRRFGWIRRFSSIGQPTRPGGIGRLHSTDRRSPTTPGQSIRTAIPEPGINPSRIQDRGEEIRHPAPDSIRVAAPIP